MNLDERISYLAHKYGMTLHIVEDLAQDMRLMLIEGIHPKYLERRVIDVLRSRRYKYTSSYDIVYDITDSLYHDADEIIDKVVLDVYLDSLSNNDRTVMEYRLSGYTCHEIGELIGKTHSLVSKRLQRIFTSS